MCQQYSGHITAVQWTHNCNRATYTSGRNRPRQVAIQLSCAAVDAVGPDIDTDLVSPCGPTAGQGMVQSGTAAVRRG